jgi:regulatory protein
LAAQAFIILFYCGTIMAVKQERHRRPLPPLDPASLEQTALRYVGRYAVTRARLRAYLARKLRERGWDAAGEPPVEAIVARCAELRYVDDTAFAVARSAALGRRGYGARRVDQALAAAGIEENDAAPAREQARAEAWASALRFVERRRLGPFGAVPLERPEREKALAAMMRAGHPLRIARRLIEAAPGEIPESDE